MKIKKNLRILCIFCVILIGCSKGPEATDVSSISVSDVHVTIQPGTVSTMEPYIFKTSEPETATIHGILLVLDPQVMIPDPNDAIFMPQLSEGDESITTIPRFETGDVLQAEVDERTGEFVFVNIQPGHYAIVVLTTQGLQIPAKYHENGNLAIVIIEESDIATTIELGYLRFP